MKQLWLAAGSLALALEDCGKQETLIIEMRVEDRACVRSLARDEGEGAAPPHLSERFTGPIPDALGGPGSFSVYATSLGAAFCYGERLAGAIDPLEIFESIEWRADLSTELLLGFLGRELRGHPKRGEVLRWIDRDLRRDLKGLAFHLQQAVGDFARDEPDSSDPASLEALFLFGQFLSELEYGGTDFISSINGFFTDGGIPLLLQELRERLAVEPGKAELACLASEEAFDTAYRVWSDERSGVLEHLELFGFGDWLASWLERADTEQGPFGPLGDLADLDLFGRDSKYVRARLRTGVKPFYTNGAFGDEDSTLVWAEERLVEHRWPPVFHYALWSVPDEIAQTRHFGRVLLRDEDLWEYGLAQQALDERDRTAWEEFVATLESTQDLPERLRAFRFKGESSDAPSRALAVKRQLEGALASAAIK